MEDIVSWKPRLALCSLQVCVPKWKVEVREARRFLCPAVTRSLEGVRRQNSVGVTTMVV